MLVGLPAAHINGDDFPGHPGAGRGSKHVKTCVTGVIMERQYPATALPRRGGLGTKPFEMASSLSPIPAKLVKRIQALEFVEMRDLLPDNMALAERLEALPGSRMGQPQKNAEQWGIGLVIMWPSCFATYVAIVSQTHPERTMEMLAYMRLMIREAHKHGGNGWLTYDAVFRRNKQGKDRAWDVLDPSLHMAYIAGQGTGLRIPCKHCNEADHSYEDCALASLALSTKMTQQEREGLPLPSPRPLRLPFQAATASAPEMICISWNRGQCVFPGACSYKHTCAMCDSGEHRAKDCALAHPDSIYKQPKRHSDVHW